MPEYPCSGGLRRALNGDPIHVLPAIETPHPDLPGGEQAEEEHLRGLGVGERALGLDPPAELPVEPLGGIGGPERLPLALGEPVEGQEFLPGFQEARGDLRGEFPPLGHEAVVGSPGLRLASRLDDPVVVGRDLLGRVPGGIEEEIAQRMHQAALHGHARPGGGDGVRQPRTPVEDQEHRPLQTPAQQPRHAARPGLGRPGGAHL